MMSRTANAPDPAGKITRSEALAFGLVLSLLLGDAARHRSSTGSPARCSPSPSSSMP
jgi:hypothetical protein